MKYRRTPGLVNHFSFFLFIFYRGGWIAFPLVDCSIRKFIFIRECGLLLLKYAKCSNRNNSADKRKFVDKLITWSIDSLPDSSGLTLTLQKIMFSTLSKISFALCFLCILAGFSGFYFVGGLGVLTSVAGVMASVIPFGIGMFFADKAHEREMAEIRASL